MPTLKHFGCFADGVWRTRFYGSYNHNAYSLRMGQAQGTCNIVAGFPIPSSATSTSSGHPGNYLLVIHIQHCSARIRALSSVSDASRWNSIETREWAWYFFFLLASYAMASRALRFHVSCMQVTRHHGTSQYKVTTSLFFTLNPRA